MYHFDGAVVLNVAIVATGGEAIEVGAVGNIGGIPEFIVGGDVFSVIDADTPLVVDIEAVDGIAETVDKILDDKAIIDAIAIGRHHIGELQEVVDDKNVVGSSIGANDDIA